MNVTRIRSPAVTSICGPGTMPLMDHASTGCPPFTGYHLTCSAVKVKCFAPSGSITYFAGWPPYWYGESGTLARIAFVLPLELPIVLDDELLAVLLLLLDAPVLDAPKPKLTMPTIKITAINKTTTGAFHHECFDTGRSMLA